MVFHVKAKNERSTSSGSRCRQNIKDEKSRRDLVDYVKELHQKAWRACSTIIFPHSTNQIFDLWRCPGRCRRNFLNSLLGSFSVVDWNGNDNATNKEFDWSSEEK